jgi:far upstream element-binding protein
MMILISMTTTDDAVDDARARRRDDEYDRGRRVAANDGRRAVTATGPYDRARAAARFGGGGDEGATRANANAAPDLANLLRQVNEAMAQGGQGQEHGQQARGGRGQAPARVISGADPRARRAARANANASASAAAPTAAGMVYGQGQGMYGAPMQGGGPPPPPPPAVGRFGGASAGYGGGVAAAPQFGPGSVGYGAPPGPPGPPRAVAGVQAMDPSSVTEYVMCPNESAGKVIGHGGEKINSIQTESGAIVKIQNQNEVGPGQPRRITISGAPERVAHASQLVYAIIGQSSASRAAQAPRGAGGGRDAAGAEIFVPVEPDQFGKIIGRGGETIRRLQEESGVRMQVDRPNSRVQITGDASGCEVARTLLQEVLDATNEPVGMGTSGAQSSTEISAQGQEGRIIGKGGENIRSLAAQTGAKLSIIKETGMVRIQGDPRQIEDAVRAVNEFIDAQVNPVKYPNAVGGGAGIPSNGAYHPPEDSGGLTPYKPLWETHQSPEGYTYYYNTTTGETTWEEPEDYDGFS